MTHEERLEVAREVLSGLAVGDALGEALGYSHYKCRQNSNFESFPEGSLRYTDDTEMALGIYDTLQLMRGINEDALAWKFGQRFLKNPDRGYGKSTRRILNELSSGAEWKPLSQRAFGGGSFGNGAAMRVAPVGAYFHDDPSVISVQASKSAIVTHAHPDGIAGAVGVALAVSAAYSARGQSGETGAQAIWQCVMNHLPSSRVKDRLHQIEGRDASPKTIAKEVGCGYDITAQDTVPFCIWNAAHHLSSFREAVLSTIEVGGDCDTNAAIVAAIVCAFSGKASIPRDWLRATEPLG